MSRLDGRVAVVTGGNSGIGLAVARRFAREGARVVVTARRGAELEAAAAEVGGLEAVAGDVTDPAHLDRLFALVRERHGRLDALVASAGVSEAMRLDDITEAHLDRVLGLNARATLFTAQKALPLMAGGGSVVLLGSIAGSLGPKGYTAYSASKAALRSFARTWANELAPRGIRVNVLAPGPIDTPMFDAMPADARAALARSIPLGRFGRPDEVAAAALFLASDDSSFMTGAELCLDGGMTQV